MAMIQFLREEYAFMQNALLAIDTLKNTFLVHMVYIYLTTDLSLGTMKSRFELICLLKGIRNLCLDIHKLGAAQRIFLTLKQGLCEHPFLLSRTVVCLCS